MYFANHARTVTLVVRGDSLEKSMSRYLIDQLREQVERRRSQLRSEVVAAHGDTHLTAIDIRDARAATCSRTTAAACSSSSAPMRKPAGCPRDIARDARGYVLTGDDVVKAGRWSQRPRPLPARIERPGVFACGDVRLSPVKRVASAVGEGSMAIAFVHKYLQRGAT